MSVGIKLYVFVYKTNICISILVLYSKEDCLVKHTGRHYSLRDTDCFVHLYGKIQSPRSTVKVELARPLH